MRIKNDICIKSYQLANTMFLTNEEFGILIRTIMLQDDQENLRYENFDEETNELLKEYEKQWEEDYNRICEKNKGLMVQAFACLKGQTKRSRKAFDKLNEQKQAKKEQAERKEKTKIIEKTEYFYIDKNEDFIVKENEETENLLNIYDLSTEEVEWFLNKVNREEKIIKELSTTSKEDFEQILKETRKKIYVENE